MCVCVCGVCRVQRHEASLRIAQGGSRPVFRTCRLARGCEGGEVSFSVTNIFPARIISAPGRPSSASFVSSNRICVFLTGGLPVETASACSRERRVARSGNFDLVTAREAHQGMVCWTSPRTAHEQTENRNASAVQVVVRACSSTKRKRDAGRALRSRRSTSQESAPLVVRAVRADLRVNSFLLSCSRACRSLSLGRRHGVNQSLAPKQVETAGACRGDRQKMAVWNSSARGWRPLRGHHPS